MYTDEFENDGGEDFDDGPDESDLTTEDHVNFYQDGRLAFTLQVQERPGSRYKRDAKEGELSDAAMWRQIDAHMKRTRFYPNVWWISDHGNAHLLTRPKRPKRARSRRRR